MNPSAFLALQDLDTALDVITHQRPRLPEVIAHQQAAAAVAELAAGLAEAQQRIDAAQAAIEASEHAAGELTKKRSRLEAQLKTVIAPREAEALMHDRPPLAATDSTSSSMWRWWASDSATSSRILL